MKVGLVFSISNFFINKIPQGRKSVRGLAAAIYLYNFGTGGQAFWSTNSYCLSVKMDIDFNPQRLNHIIWYAPRKKNQASSQKTWVFGLKSCLMITRSVGTCLMPEPTEASKSKKNDSKFSPKTKTVQNICRYFSLKPYNIVFYEKVEPDFKHV